MVTPYDWQEGISHRAQFAESRLASGSPVLAISRPDGILAVTYRGQSTKLFEIYDRIFMAAVGLQSDVEAIRVAAIDFAHQEGFNRSEEDVTVQRLVNGLSASIKRSFADFNSAPVIARTMFVEVCSEPEADKFMILDFDGDYRNASGVAAVAGSVESGLALEEKLKKVEASRLNTAIEALDKIWQGVREEPEEDGSDYLTREVILMERSEDHINRFRRIEG